VQGGRRPSRGGEKRTKKVRIDTCGGKASATKWTIMMMMSERENKSGGRVDGGRGETSVAVDGGSAGERVVFAVATVAAGVVVFLVRAERGFDFLEPENVRAEVKRKSSV
jgi:hypothetical protein